MRHCQIPPICGKLDGMRFISKLYLGETVQKKQERLVSRLKKHKFLPGTYVICLPEGGSAPLEYMKAGELYKSWYDRHEPWVIGIAGDEDEAIALISQIIKDCMIKTGSLSLRSYAVSLLDAGRES